MASGRISIRRPRLRYGVIAAFFARDAQTCATVAAPRDVQRLFEDWDALRFWRRDRVNGYVHFVLFERSPLLDEDNPLIAQLRSTLRLSETEPLVIAELERLRARRDEYDEEYKRAEEMRDPHLRAEMREPFHWPPGVMPGDGPMRVSTGRSFWSPEEREERVNEYRERKERYKEQVGATRRREHWHEEVQALRRIGMTRDQIWELRKVPLCDSRTRQEAESKVWWPSMTMAALTRYTTPAALRTAPRSAR